MPSKNMLPKGKRRHSVRAEYRKLRTELEERKAQEAAAREAAFIEPDEDSAGLYDTADFFDEDLPDTNNPFLRIGGAPGSRNAEEVPDEPRYPGLRPAAPDAPSIRTLALEPRNGVRSFVAEPAAGGMRLDAFLARALPDISRARVQVLIDGGQVTVDDTAAKASTKLKGGERIAITGEPQPAPLRAEPEDIPLRIVYEDNDLAVIDKPAGMAVHAGAGSAESNRGTLVNALLFRFGRQLSTLNDAAVRPGIVHRLDKDTSGLILVAKNDSAHRKLAAMFTDHSLRKVYLALVHGHLARDEGSIDLPVGRDPERRIRMTTRGGLGARAARSAYRVLERIDSVFGRFTLVEVQIETGRTHQIRVHMQALGHPVVGDPLYGAPRVLRSSAHGTLEPARQFLHAAELDFTHPRTGKPLELRSELPEDLRVLLEKIKTP